MEDEEGWGRLGGGGGKDGREEVGRMGGRRWEGWEGGGGKDGREEVGRMGGRRMGKDERRE